MSSGLGAEAKLNTIDLKIIAWHASISCAAAISQSSTTKRARLDLCFDIGGKLRDPSCRAALVELTAQLRHTFGDGNDGANRRGLLLAGTGI